MRTNHVSRRRFSKSPALFQAGGCLFFAIGLWGFRDNASAQTPPSGGYAITLVGLSGSQYQYSGGTGISSDSVVLQIASSGDVVGYTQRYNASNQNIGQDAWFFNGTSNQLIGLTGSGYGYTYTGGGIDEYGYAQQVNNGGQAIGSSNRYNASGADLGSDAWFFNGNSTQVIGLTGAGYSYTYAGTGGGTYRESGVNYLLANGWAGGSSNRYNASGSPLGRDAYLFNGTSSTAIGLSGSGYSYAYSGTGGGTYNFGFLEDLNSSGDADGNTYRYNASGVALGEDAWLYNGTSSAVIGPTGSGYEYTYTGTGGGTYRYNAVMFHPDSGSSVGIAKRYNASGTALGQDAWIFNGTTTSVIGLTGSDYDYTSTGAGGGTYQYGVPQQMTSNGQVSGYTYRFNSSGVSLGQDAWVYNGASTQLIGLTGSGYEYSYTGTGGGTYRYSLPSFAVNSAGQAAGVSSRYSSSGVQLGADAWIYNGSATSQIGLTGTNYEYSTSDGTYRNATVASINANGDVMGTTARFTSSGGSLGSSGWFYDNNNQTTYPLEFSFQTGTDDCTTTPEYLTNNDVVLGSYELYSGSTDVGKRAFYWDLQDGFHDLGGLVGGGLTATGWQYLSTVFSNLGSVGATPNGSPKYIVGYGDETGQTGAQDAYLLTAAPEPSSLALFSLAGFASLRLRGRAKTTSKRTLILRISRAQPFARGYDSKITQWLVRRLALARPGGCRGDVRFEHMAGYGWFEQADGAEAAKS